MLDQSWVGSEGVRMKGQLYELVCQKGLQPREQLRTLTTLSSSSKSSTAASDAPLTAGPGWVSSPSHSVSFADRSVTASTLAGSLYHRYMKLKYASRCSTRKGPSLRRKTGFNLRSSHYAVYMGVLHAWHALHRTMREISLCGSLTTFGSSAEHRSARCECVLASRRLTFADQRSRA